MKIETSFGIAPAGKKSVFVLFIQCADRPPQGHDPVLLALKVRVSTRGDGCVHHPHAIVHPHHAFRVFRAKTVGGCKHGAVVIGCRGLVERAQGPPAAERVGCQRLAKIRTDHDQQTGIEVDFLHGHQGVRGVGCTTVMPVLASIVSVGKCRNPNSNPHKKAYLSIFVGIPPGIFRQAAINI